MLTIHAMPNLSVSMAPFADPDGNRFMALAMRELNQHLRETGESRGLNAGFTARDRSAFLQALDEAVVRAKRG